MFAVIFEVQSKKSHWDDYLNLAKRLKPELEKIDGFIDNERFRSRRTQGRILSLSTWRFAPIMAGKLHDKLAQSRASEPPNLAQIGDSESD